MAEQENIMVIDTDCGVDDALALLLALSYQDQWKILAITCCNGNTSVDNACNNVLKVLNLCDRSDIPVYRGCEKPLLPLDKMNTKVHGDDGLGNVAHEFSSGTLKVSEGHAVNTLVQLAKEHRQKIHLVALAPLTNLAMAHRLDPEFTSNLKSLTFMGGNIHGIGNTSSAAEFNFACDPEAAHIICTEALCPTTMIPWETALQHTMPWMTFQKLVSGTTPKTQFFNKITVHLSTLQRSRKRPGFVMADALAVAILVDSSCATASENYAVKVETAGFLTRGQACVQWRPQVTSVEECIIELVTGLNSSTLFSLVHSMLSG